MTTEGKVMAVCVSDRKGIPKHDVGSGVLRVDWGIEGDAHAGNWHRQVSLLAMESIDKVRAKGLNVHPGDFAENITTEGMTQIGKVCHKGCTIFELSGDCVMPREGIFVKILAPGTVSVGDAVTILPPSER